MFFRIHVVRRGDDKTWEFTNGFIPREGDILDLDISDEIGIEDFRPHEVKGVMINLSKNEVFIDVKL